MYKKGFCSIRSGRGLFPLLLLALSGCSSQEVVKEDVRASFYETCYRLSRLPEGTTDSDIDYAGEIFKSSLPAETGVFAYGKKGRNYCIFTGSQIPEDVVPGKADGNPIASYLLNAFFNSDNALTFVKRGGKVEKVSGEEGAEEAMDWPYAGIEISGNSRSLVYFSNYLKMLKIPNISGPWAGGWKVLVEADEENRYLNVPFLFNVFRKMGWREKLYPGDLARLHPLGDENVEIRFHMESWKRKQVTPSDRSDKVNGLEFNVSFMNLPFSDEQLLGYLYSLTETYRNSESGNIYYSPQFMGYDPEVRVKLYSSEILFPAGASMEPERFLSWILSAAQFEGKYPDSYYANLLSLRVAKKMFTGSPSFLGGDLIREKSAAIPVERISSHLFRNDRVLGMGNFRNLYLQEGEIFSESTSLRPGKAKRIKAFFGNPKYSRKSVASIVVRSKNPEREIERIEKILRNGGFFRVIQKIDEKIEGEGWGAVSILLGTKEERKLLKLYRTKLLAVKDNISLGVYRVEEEK